MKPDLVTSPTYMFTYTRLYDIIDWSNTAALPRAEMQVKGSSGTGQSADRAGLLWDALAFWYGGTRRACTVHERNDRRSVEQITAVRTRHMHKAR